MKMDQLFDTSNPNNQLGPIVVAVIVAIVVFVAAIGSQFFHH